MKNSEDRSPHEWAEHLRDCVADIDPDVRHIVSYLTAADCDELAARMDDLEEALRLLRDEPIASDERGVRQAWNDRTDALLARYQEVDSE